MVPTVPKSGVVIGLARNEGVQNLCRAWPVCDALPNAVRNQFARLVEHVGCRREAIFRQV
jgi:hypothetical protein